MQIKLELMKYKHIFLIAFARSPEKGAATTLNCAVNPALNSQQAFYYDSCKVSPHNPDAR